VSDVYGWFVLLQTALVSHAANAAMTAATAATMTLAPRAATPSPGGVGPGVTLPEGVAPPVRVKGSVAVPVPDCVSEEGGLGGTGAS